MYLKRLQDVFKPLKKHFATSLSSARHITFFFSFSSVNSLYIRIYYFESSECNSLTKILMCNADRPDTFSLYPNFLELSRQTFTLLAKNCIFQVYF